MFEDSFIYGFNIDLIFNGSNFVNINGKGTIINVDNGYVVVNDSNFTNSNISAIIVNRSNLTLNNILFDNIICVNGLISAYNGNLTINNNTFKSIKNGSIFYLNNSNIVLTNSRFININSNNNIVYSINSVLKFNSLDFINCTSNKNLIFTNNSNLLMNSILFDYVTVNASVISNIRSTSIFNGVTFDNITLFGGNIVNDVNGSLNFNNVVFQNLVNGVLIYTNNTSFIFENTRFKKVKGDMGILHSVNSNININNLIFSDFNSTTNSFYINGGILSFKNPTFEKITLEGGAYLISTNNSSINITNSIFNSTFNGKIISIGSGTVNIKNSTFKNLKSNIISNNGRLTIINSTFNDIYLNDESLIYNTGILNINNSLFKCIVSNSDGGVIYSENTLIIVSSNFTGNKAVSGGVLYSVGLLFINSSIFTSNSAELGGCLYIGSGSANISYSQFKGNNATDGGGIYSEGVLSLVACKFENNNASSGGAVYSTNILTVRGGGISNNNADYGSGIYSSGVLNLFSVAFVNNVAKVSIVIQSPTTAYKGSIIVVEAYLLSGDNVLSAIYSVDSSVYKDGVGLILSDKPQNKIITVKINDNTYSGMTDSEGIATFKIQISSEISTNNAVLIASSLQNSFLFSISKKITYASAKSSYNKVVNLNKGGKFITKSDRKNLVKKLNAELKKAKKGSAAYKKLRDAISRASKLKTGNPVAKMTYKSTKKYLKSTINNKNRNFREGLIFNKNAERFQWSEVPNTRTIENHPAGLRNTSSKNSKSFFTGQYATYMLKSSKVSYDSATGRKTVVIVESFLVSNLPKSLKNVGKKYFIRTNKTVSYETYSYYPNKYTSPSTNCEVNDPLIVKKAKELTSKFNYYDFYGKANAIYKWVSKNVTYNIDANYPAKYIISNDGVRYANCVGYSNLIAALCRAVGIPARYHNIVYYEGFRYPFESPHLGHAYVELYVNENGWNNIADGAWQGTHDVGDTTYVHRMVHELDNRTHDNKLYYFDLNCNHYLNSSHRDTNVKSVNISIYNPDFFKISSLVLNSGASAYNAVKPYIINKSNEKYSISNIPLNGIMIDPITNTTIEVWAFHIFKDTNNRLDFLGYCIVGKNGYLYLFFSDSVITNGPINFGDYYSVIYDINGEV